MFLHEAKQILRTYLLFLRPCSPLRAPKMVFSRSNFSDNSVLVPSSMHFNVELLYLLLFFAVGVGIGVAVLVSKGPYWLYMQLERPKPAKKNLYRPFPKLF